MIKLLAKLFIKDHDDVGNPVVRRAWGTLISAVGILLNLFLFAVKLIAGTLSGSISIRADAVNNLSDAGSSVISLVSFKLSAKPADREHPYGHARIEYIASMIVSFLILFIGVELVRSSIDKLMAPVDIDFNLIAVIILGVSVLIKLGMGVMNLRVGKRIQSEVMTATATDCFSDAGATFAVLAATLLSRVLPASVAPYVDPVMGLLVAALILWAGLRVLNETKNVILGEAPDDETIEAIRKVVGEYPDALGIHDLYVHKYGPCRTMASLHVEVDGKQDVFRTHDTIDLIERRLQNEYNIDCTIHLDPIVTDDERVTFWRQKTEEMAQKYHNGIRIHDFRMVPGPTHTNLIFDVEVPFELSLSNDEISARLAADIAAEAPEHFAVITVDRI